MQYVIINSLGLYLMQIGLDHSFTKDVSLAIRFVARENAYLKIKKLPMLTGLSVKAIKI